MSRKIFAIIFSVVLLASLLAIDAFAAAMNPTGGCTTETTVKRAATGAVVHDGVISPGEYTEVEINRDSDTTDLLLSWDGSGDTLIQACEFLQNVHFYTSWDENGINLAAQATLLEDPHCEGTFPTVYSEYEGKTFPGDEFFMFQFGCVFKIEVPSEGIDGAVLYRAIGVNTETGEQLYGWYWDHGRTGSLSQTAGTDYYTRVDGRTVTYEMTLPFESVLESDQIRDSLPVDGTGFYFTISLTGGSQGYGHNGNVTYAVSLGDGGYMTVARMISNFSGAHGIISNETVTGQSGDPAPDDPTPSDPTPGNDSGSTPAGPSNDQGQQVVIDPDQYEVTTDDEGNEIVVDRETGEEVDVNTLPTVTPAKTGDPMIVMAAIAAVSAAGAFIAGKKRR